MVSWFPAGSLYKLLLLTVSIKKFIYYMVTSFLDVCTFALIALLWRDVADTTVPMNVVLPDIVFVNPGASLLQRVKTYRYFDLMPML